MMFKFSAITSFVPYLIVAFLERDAAKLAGGVFTFMVYKQLAMNIMEMVKYESNTKLRINKIKREFEIKIENETCPFKIRELKLIGRIEKQIKMDKVSFSHVNMYKETVIQFGYLAIFGSVMPLAPFFAWIANGLECIIRFKSMCLYSRRVKAQSTSSIGAWLGIVETLTFFAIPVNAFIVFFTGNKEYETSGKAVMFDPLIDRNPDYWTSEKIFMFVVLVEHGLLCFKLFISSFIPDVPKSVKKDQNKKKLVAETAKKHLDKVKKTPEGDKFRSFEERMMM